MNEVFTVRKKRGEIRVIDMKTIFFYLGELFFHKTL